MNTEHTPNYISREDKNKRETERKTLYKGIMIESLPVIGLMFLAYFMFWLFGNTVTPYLIGGLLVWVTFQDARGVWRGSLAPRPSRLFVRVGKTLITLYSIFFVSSYFGGYGLLGFVFAGVLVSAYLLWRNREKYMWWIRHIESEYFGMTAEERREMNRREKIWD